jgi:hypothetical protein
MTKAAMRSLVTCFFFLVVVLMAPLGTVAARDHFDDDDYSPPVCPFSSVPATCPGGWAAVMNNIVDVAGRNSPRFVQLAFRTGEEAVVNMAKHCEKNLDSAVKSCYSAKTLASIGIEDPGLHNLMQRCGMRTLRELMCFLRACGTFASEL